MGKEYPYQDLTLKTIRGERWDDLPGLEGYYKISNCGRVKRLQYEMQYKNGAIYLKEEKIIKPSIVRQINKFKGDQTFFLTNRVVLNKMRFTFTVARMVYHCFVESFNLHDPSIVIICRDDDNFNIKPSNLKKLSISQKQGRIVQRERFQSPFSNLSEDLKRKQRKSIVESVSKQVTQYSLKGKKIKVYPSMAAAERATGVCATLIGSRAGGKGRTAGGFRWQWGDADHLRQ